MNKYKIKIRSLVFFTYAAFIVCMYRPIQKSVRADSPKIWNSENGHWYQLIDIPMTWHEAKEYCLTIDGYLVTINSASENSFVYNNVASWGWLGATDEVNEGEWSWVTGESWSYANWAPYEPNNGVWPGHDGPYQHYLTFAPPYPSQWDDMNDGETAFTCEGEKATPAELAKLIVGKQYILGGKGYDWVNGRFLGSLEITGLDCSGVVYWAYNKAYGTTRYQDASNPVYYENADGQYKHNTTVISEDELQPGDLMFFDWDHDGFIQHVAMYVGDNLVVSAQSPQAHNSPGAIAIFDLAFIKEWDGFVGYRRVISPKIGFRVQVHSPVNLAVLDPNGNTITHETYVVTNEEIIREVPGSLYYTEWDSDSDSELDASVVAPIALGGDYSISVIPKPDASMTATYSLDVNVNGEVTILAEHVKTADIPQQGYTIAVVQYLRFLPIIIR